MSGYSKHFKSYRVNEENNYGNMEVNNENLWEILEAHRQKTFARLSSIRDNVREQIQQIKNNSPYEQEKIYRNFKHNEQEYNNFDQYYFDTSNYEPFENFNNSNYEHLSKGKNFKKLFEEHKERTENILQNITDSIMEKIQEIKNNNMQQNYEQVHENYSFKHKKRYEKNYSRNDTSNKFRKTNYSRKQQDRNKTNSYNSKNKTVSDQYKPNQVEENVVYLNLTHVENQNPKTSKNVNKTKRDMTDKKHIEDVFSKLRQKFQTAVDDYDKRLNENKNENSSDNENYVRENQNFETIREDNFEFTEQEMNTGETSEEYYTDTIFNVNEIKAEPLQDEEIIICTDMGENLNFLNTSTINENFNTSDIREIGCREEKTVNTLGENSGEPSTGFTGKNSFNTTEGTQLETKYAERSNGLEQSLKLSSESCKVGKPVSDFVSSDTSEQTEVNILEQEISSKIVNTKKIVEAEMEKILQFEDDANERQKHYIKTLTGIRKAKHKYRAGTNFYPKHSNRYGKKFSTKNLPLNYFKNEQVNKYKWPKSHDEPKQWNLRNENLKQSNFNEFMINGEVTAQNTIISSLSTMRNEKVEDKTQEQNLQNKTENLQNYDETFNNMFDYDSETEEVSAKNNINMNFNGIEFGQNRKMIIYKNSNKIIENLLLDNVLENLNDTENVKVSRIEDKSMIIKDIRNDSISEHITCNEVKQERDRISCIKSESNEMDETSSEVSTSNVFHGHSAKNVKHTQSNENVEGEKTSTHTLRKTENSINIHRCLNLGKSIRQHNKACGQNKRGKINKKIAANLNDRDNECLSRKQIRFKESKCNLEQNDCKKLCLRKKPKKTHSVYIRRSKMLHFKKRYRKKPEKRVCSTNRQESQMTEILIIKNNGKFMNNVNENYIHPKIGVIIGRENELQNTQKMWKRFEITENIERQNFKRRKKEFQTTSDVDMEIQQENEESTKINQVRLGKCESSKTRNIYYRILGCPPKAAF